LICYTPNRQSANCNLRQGLSESVMHPKLALVQVFQQTQQTDELACDLVTTTHHSIRCFNNVFQNDQPKVSGKPNKSKKLTDNPDRPQTKHHMHFLMWTMKHTSPLSAFQL